MKRLENKVAVIYSDRTAISKPVCKLFSTLIQFQIPGCRLRAACF